MGKDFWTAAGLVFGAIASAPIVLASVRAIFFFGQVSQSVTNMERRFDEHVSKVDKFIDEVHEFVDTSNIRLTRIEEARKAEERFGRRATDMPQ